MTWPRSAGERSRRSSTGSTTTPTPRRRSCPVPYESAAVLCVDGVGEWATTTIWHGRGTTLEPVAEIRYPHSLGLLYSAFTHFCGFKVNSGEYKLMGLAPYGQPVYADLIRRELIDIKPDGSFRLHSTTSSSSPAGR